MKDKSLEYLQYLIAKFFQNEYGESEPDFSEPQISLLYSTFDLDLEDTNIKLGRVGDLERFVQVDLDLNMFQYIYCSDHATVKEQSNLELLLEDFETMQFDFLYTEALLHLRPLEKQHYDDVNTVKFIAKDEMDRLLGSPQTFLGKFIFESDAGVVAIDNSMGQAKIEEFSSVDQATLFLINGLSKKKIDQIFSKTNQSGLIHK